MKYILENYYRNMCVIWMAYDHDSVLTICHLPNSVEVVYEWRKYVKQLRYRHLCNYNKKRFQIYFFKTSIRNEMEVAE